MYEKQYRFEIKGLSPLIMHWDNIMWADQMSDERTAIKETDRALFKAGDDRCPPHTWRGCTYNDGNVIVLPTDNLRSCMMKAGARKTLKDRKTFKELTQSSMLFDELYCTLLVGGQSIDWKSVEAISGKNAKQAEAVKALGFKLLAKRAKVGQSKHVRVRPIFDKWSTSGLFTVVDEQLTLEIVQQIWTIAGLSIGLCDWRPGASQSPGPYGRYSAEIQPV